MAITRTPKRAEPGRQLLAFALLQPPPHATRTEPQRPRAAPPRAKRERLRRPDSPPARRLRGAHHTVVRGSELRRYRSRDVARQPRVGAVRGAHRARL